MNQVSKSKSYNSSSTEKKKHMFKEVLRLIIINVISFFLTGDDDTEQWVKQPAEAEFLLCYGTRDLQLSSGGETKSG